MSDTPSDRPNAAGTRATRSRVARVPWADIGWSAASIVLLLGVWQLVGNRFGALFAPFTTSISRLWDDTTSGQILPALSSTGEVYIAALALSILIGTVVGLALARNQLLSDAFETNLYILYATPTITLVPFMFAAFGYGFWPQVVIAMTICIFPILIGTMEGARSLPTELIDVARTHRSNEAQLWRHVIVPFVVPHIMTGVKQAIPLALVGTLVAQFFLNATGVAALLLTASSNIDVPQVFAITLLISIFAIILVGIGELVERAFTRWR